MRVRGSFSFPKTPSGRPLKLTSIPPAFPVLRIRVFPALTFLRLSAVKTRSITDLPSATIETQESSLATICTKNALAAAGASADSTGTACRLGCVGACFVAGAESLVESGGADVADCGFASLRWGSVAVAGWRVLSTEVGLCSFDL